MKLPRHTTLALAAAVVAALAFLAAPGSCASAEHAAPTKGDAALYLSPSGSDAGRCAPASPCATFARAFAIAQPGQKVEVAGGYYGDCSQPLTGVKSDYVTFEALPGAVPWTTCALRFQGDRVRFKNMKLDGLLLGGRHIVLDHVDVTCLDQAPFKLYGPSVIAPNSPGPVSASGYYCSAFLKGTTQHFKMLGGSIGPTYADQCVGSEDSSLGYSAPTVIADDLVFDGVTIHGARFRGASGCSAWGTAHTELFYLTAVRNVVIKNSHFYDGGSSADIFITDQNQGVRSQNIVIANNIFDRSTNIAVNASYVDGLQIAYNTFPFGGMWIAGGTDISFVGNLGEHNLCPSPRGLASYSHNVWFFDNSTGGSADSCGPTDTIVNSDGTNIFVKMAPHGDFRLRAGSPAVGKGDSARYPLRDRAGLCRVRQGNPDAGAFELAKPKPILKPAKRPATKPTQKRGKSSTQSKLHRKLDQAKSGASTQRSPGTEKCVPTGPGTIVP